MSRPLTLITSHLDNNTLERLSHTRAWQEVALSIKQHNYWFLRVENFLGKQLAHYAPSVVTYKQADWKTTYYDLTKIRIARMSLGQDDCFFNLLRLECKTTLSLETLLEAGYYPSMRMLSVMFSSSLIREQRDFAVTLLEHKNVKGNDQLIYLLYMRCAGIARSEEVQLITSYLSDDIVRSIQACFS